ncbi:hypothetical protein ACN50G_08640 [Lentilactobacillus buchneri]|uniref:Uncharacterized protein n=1 Tax=Lentilactobacillus buchneri DSM 20057 TaxID=1423728 RepID=A0A4R5NPU0_LENBU|nr:hypothetical protein [Lentilactobacillus buchneri]MCT3253457.1 hypothetical protein [Lentilactobacillus buchneri]MCT3548049.1 hypothetical protein [Lentilactobacillus buchneri]MCT4438517.1 hypothetical protein [Lentilactobacillus buchneri]MQM69564.1 hypothetical protein [Lentilactobacillus buchneri]QUX05611.1 hypothetical protein KE627_00120 [Lentilactobacillus buchneri]
MNMKKSLLLGITALTLGLSVSATAVSANHNFFYWEHPHWVTVTRSSTIYKIKRTYPLVNSYVVKKYHVYYGHHLLIHHAASYDWQVESGHFNSNSYYTYSVNRSSYSWFKQGIH